MYNFTSLGLKVAILIESPQNLNMDMKEIGFYGFKKRILEDQDVKLFIINDEEWKDMSYE